MPGENLRASGHMQYEVLPHPAALKTAVPECGPRHGTTSQKCYAPGPGSVRPWVSPTTSYGWTPHGPRRRVAVLHAWSTSADTARATWRPTWMAAEPLQRPRLRACREARRRAWGVRSLRDSGERKDWMRRVDRLSEGLEAVVAIRSLLKGAYRYP